jgi:hypothetical protein
MIRGLWPFGLATQVIREGGAPPSSRRGRFHCASQAAQPQHVPRCVHSPKANENHLRQHSVEQAGIALLFDRGGLLPIATQAEAGDDIDDTINEWLKQSASDLSGFGHRHD